MIKKPKGPTAKRRAARKRLKDREYQRVVAMVDARDGRRSRYSGLPGTEHHHIVYRSRGGKHETGNLVTLTTQEHRDVHAKRLIITGNADGQLTFLYRERS